MRTNTQKNIWAVCNSTTKLIEFEGHKIKQKFDLKRTVRQVQMLGDDEFLTSLSQSEYHYQKGNVIKKGPMMVKSAPVSRPRVYSFRRMWIENGTYCVMTKSRFNSPTAYSYCLENNVWKGKTHLIGTIQEVKKIDGIWWGFFRKGSKYSVAYLENPNATKSTWKVVNTWAQTPNAVPFFVSVEGGGVAYAENRGVWVYDGTAFKLHYDKVSVRGVLRPVIDAKGQLVKRCGASICFYDSQSKLVKKIKENVRELIALKDGILMHNFVDLYLLRGGRKSLVNDLTPELKMGASDQYYTQIFDGDHGQVVFLVRTSVGGQGVNRILTFDGLKLKDHGMAPYFPYPRRAIRGSFDRYHLRQIVKNSDGTWMSPTHLHLQGFAIDSSLKKFANVRTNTLAESTNDVAVVGSKVYLASDLGIWRCDQPTQEIKASTLFFEVTKGCTKLSQRRMVKRISYLEKYKTFVLKIGTAIMLSKDLKGFSKLNKSEINRDILEVDSVTGVISWVENNKLQVNFDLSSKQRKEISLGGTLKLNKLQGNFLCARDGVYGLDQEKWTKVSNVNGCYSLAGDSKTAYVVNRSNLLECNVKSCKKLTQIPGSFLPGDFIDLFTPKGGAPRLLINMGRRLYQLNAAKNGFNKVTPMSGLGSVILGKPTQFKNGVITLQKSGAVFLPGSLDPKLRVLRF